MKDGSSPLARGTFRKGLEATVKARLIPARAGNIGFSTERKIVHSAHPRSRGEHCDYAGARVCCIGSSPLARGTYESRALMNLPPRLIPARAGNIGKTTTSRLWQTAHPRSRGEHVAPLELPTRTVGSSPLARGTCSALRATDKNGRLIPARAGNITGGCIRHLAYAAHPRSRGEHRRLSLRLARLSGSSPLARGTCSVRIINARARRLIPARAGNIVIPIRGVHRAAAHPRSRGEHAADQIITQHHRGSSPLARGTSASQGHG